MASPAGKMVRRSGLIPSRSSFHVAELEHLALQPGQSVRADLAVAVAAGLDRQRHCADGAGGADRLLPAEAPQAVLDAHQFQACGGVRLGVAGRGDLAVAEVALGVADATHLQAFPQLGLETLADDELGAAAADVADQPATAAVGHAVGDAEVDQAGFLAAGDDFHGMAENLFRTTDEIAAVARLAQGVGRDHAYGTLGHAADELGEAA